MAQQLEGLKITEDQAEAIIEKGIEYEAYSDEMPDTKKEKLAAAEEIIAFSIDAYVNDKVRSDDDDPAVAEAGEQIEEILELGGVDIDDDGNVEFGDAPEAEGDDDNGDDAEDGDEAPFDPSDYIEGYAELSVVTKLKKVKELNPDDDDDAAVLEALHEWEGEQEKPSSRIMSYIEDAIELDGDEAEADDSNDDEPEAEGGDEEGEPWEGYDKATAKQIKDVLAEAADDEEDPLTVDQVEYVLDYEEKRKAPRKRVIDYCNALLEEMRKEEDGDDEPEAEAEPEESEEPKRGRGRGRGRGRAKGRDKKDEPKGDNNGVITLTREQILTALEEGKVEIEV